MKTSLPEIYEAVQKTDSKEEKLDILKENYSVSLAATLKMLYDPTIVFNIPKGLPEEFKFNKQPYSSLERMVRSMPPLVNQSEGAKVEKAWLRLMTPLSEEEVKLATALKDKDLDIGLSYADIQNLFPGLLADVSPEELVRKKEEKKEQTKSKLDNKGSDASEPVIIPDDPYDGKFKEVVVEEDASLPSPVTEDVTVVEVPEIDTPSKIETPKNEEPSKPTKKPSTKKTPTTKK